MSDEVRGIDFNKVSRLFEQEITSFKNRTPKSASLLKRAKGLMPNGVPMAWMSGFYETPPLYVDHGNGAYFTDVDDNQYLDMNQADLAMSCGFTPQPVIEAVNAQMAKGTAFLLPTEDAIHVSALLAERYDKPKWQFTLSASSANTEAIRIARAITGRDEILMFHGRYHGHWDDVMVNSSTNKEQVDLIGLPRSAGNRAANIHFNDLDSLEAALKTGRFACLIAEPALTNCGLVLPNDGFWDEAYKLCQQYGTLLIFDETHTQTFAFGGLKKYWGIDCDIYSIGKCLGGGVPIGAYGMGEEIAQFCENNIDRYRGGEVLPVGGTMFGNALSLAAAKATLTEVLTPEAYAKTDELGRQLAEGLNHIFKDNDLDWIAPQIGGRSGYCMSATMPVNSQEAETSINYTLIDARRCYLLNRGVWDAIASAGPSVSFAHEAKDIDLYLNVVGDFFSEVCS